MGFLFPWNGKFRVMQFCYCMPTTPQAQLLSLKSLEITILLSVCFFLSMVADMTPPTSEAVPLIGRFCNFSFLHSLKRTVFV